MAADGGYALWRKVRNAGPLSRGPVEESTALLRQFTSFAANAVDVETRELTSLVAQSQVILSRRPGPRGGALTSGLKTLASAGAAVPAFLAA